MLLFQVQPGRIHHILIDKGEERRCGQEPFVEDELLASLFIINLNQER